MDEAGQLRRPYSPTQGACQSAREGLGGLNPDCYDRINFQDKPRFIQCRAISARFHVYTSR
jgi:hypothetical protein